MVPGRTKTALITDASSGIGAAFVRKFAEMNYQLIPVPDNSEAKDTEKALRKDFVAQ